MVSPTQPNEADPGPGDRPLDRAAHAADLALVQAALIGEPGATNALVERLATVPAMVRGQNRRLGNPLGEEDLDEVAQETLIALWGKLERFEGRSKLETWAYGFAVRELLKALERARRQDRRVEWEEGMEPLADDGPCLRPDEYATIRQSLETVGEPASEIIELKHFEMLTFDEIGRHMSMPTNTVKTRYYRGLNRLRTLLRPTWRERLP